MQNNQLILPQLRHAAGCMTLPGSKSISNRVLLLAALCHGTTLVRSLLEADDTQVMLAALKTLGVIWQRQDSSNDYLVHGIGGRFPQTTATLLMGNAGTALRPLVAALAIQGGDYQLSGVARMHERPIGDLVDGLKQIGAAIAYMGKPGYPPLKIARGSITVTGPIQVRGDVSSQFITALLLALPMIAQTQGQALEIAVIGELISKPYVALTINLLERFGIVIERHDWSRFIVPVPARYHSPGEIFVEGDASSASYFLAAGAIAGGPVRVNGVGRQSMQGDLQFIYALEKMGAQIAMGDHWLEARAPLDGKLKALDMDCNEIPDAAMTLAICALFAQGKTTLRNIASWRVKETDRIAAMAKELTKLGAQVEEGEDFLSITPPQRWTTPINGIDTYDDHRMAMCFSLAAFSPVIIAINHPECVSKTFPDYFDVFSTLTSS